MRRTDEELIKHIENLIKRYPELNICREDIINAYRTLETCFENGGKLLIAGNGGSAADSEHMAGELMKRFRIPRPVSREFSKKCAMWIRKLEHPYPKTWNVR